MGNSFPEFHPAVQFFYFCLILSFSMALKNPVCIVISLVGSIICLSCLRGVRHTVRRLYLIIPAALAAALFNPLFSHEGATILAYFPSGNPLTLESVLYGAAAAGMLGAVLFWFSCFSEIMTADRLMYLFGRLLPSASLLLSMSLRFAARFHTQLKKVAAAQNSIGRGLRNGTLLQRAQNGLHMLSILLTWSLERAVETSDSMKGRGYGLPGRTAFSVFHWSGRDRRLAVFLFAAGAYLLTGALRGRMSFSWFPIISSAAFTAETAGLYFVYLLLCLAPALIEIREVFRWKQLPSVM